MHTKIQHRLKIFTALIIVAVVLTAIPTIPPNIGSTENSPILTEDLQAPRSQALPTNESSSVNTVNVSISQQYEDTTPKLINKSDTLIGVPAPTYPTSSAELSMANITAYNYTIIVEDDFTAQLDSRQLSSTTVYYTSFKMDYNGYIDSVSLYIYHSSSTITTNISIYLLNSTWDAINGRNQPFGTDSDKTLLGWVLWSTAGLYTVTFNNIGKYLDNSLTENNTWFIGVLASSADYWNYVPDDTTGDNSDDSWVYYYGAGTWVLDSDPNNSNKFYDPKVNITVNKGNLLVNPGDINVMVNGTPVSNGGEAGVGYWSSSDKVTATSDTLYFNITAEWYDYSITVNRTFVSYYKNDYIPVSNFTVTNSTDVYWVTSVTINEFDFRLTGNTVNFSVPIGWTSIGISNGTDQLGYSESTGNGRKYLVLAQSDSVNTTYTISAQSPNRITSVLITVDGAPVDKAYTDQILEFSAGFGVNLTGTVNLSVYNPIDDGMNHTYTTTSTTPSDTADLGTWNLSTINNFAPGNYTVRVKWNNSTDAGLRDVIIYIGYGTSMNYTPASGYEALNTDPPFNITITYLDNVTGAPIKNATIGYNPGNGWKTEVQPGNDGKYYIEIDPSNNTLYPNLGDYNIPITVNKTDCRNFTFTFILKIVNDTTASINYGAGTFKVIRGKNAVIYINYTQVWNSSVIEGATVFADSINSSLTWNVIEIGGGGYKIEINTSTADVGIYQCTFGITKFQFKTAYIQFNITVDPAGTAVTILSINDGIWRLSPLNISIDFVFTDLNNNVNITGLPPSAIRLLNETSNGTEWNTGDWNYKLIEIGNGIYRLNISKNGLDSGYYTVYLNVTYRPNYNTSGVPITFYISGNQTVYHNTGAFNHEGKMLFDEPAGYGVYEHTPYIEMQCYISDLSNNNRPLGKDVIYTYTALINGSYIPLEGRYDANTERNYVRIPTEDFTPGNYTIKVIISVRNYENATFTFNLTVIPEFKVNIQIISIPDKIEQGRAFTIVIKITYNNGTEIPLANAEITLQFNISDISVAPNRTNSEGIVTFTVTVPEGDYSGMRITVIYNGEAYGVDAGTYDTSIKVLPAPKGIPPWIMFGMIIGIAAVLSIVGIKKGIVEPRRRKFNELVMNTTAVFEDVANIRFIIIMHKASGTAIFTKSFSARMADPQLISGFVDAIQSFVRESVGTSGCEEIKMTEGQYLLINDGDLVRIALVIEKEPSNLVKVNLSRLVMMFEQKYADRLINWKGELNVFKDADELIDEVLHTSIILPHKITDDLSVLKKAKSSMETNLINIARNLLSEGKQYFFLAQLLTEAFKKYPKKQKMIMIALKDLLDKNIFVPQSLTVFEGAGGISEQEIDILRRRVEAIPGLTAEEKENLLRDLINMSPDRREATLSSLKTGKIQLTCETVQPTVMEIPETKKDAKSTIKKLVSDAKKEMKKGNYTQALKNYERAEAIAIRFDMQKEAANMRNNAMMIQIREAKDKIRRCEKYAKKYAAEGRIDEARDIVEEALHASSDLFKLGFTEYEKYTRKFTAMLNELKGGDRTGEIIDEKSAITKYKKELLKKAKSLEKKKDYKGAISAYTELAVLADKLFKFGDQTMLGEIKKYREKVKQLKDKLKEAENKGSTVTDINEETLNEQKQQLLDIALEADKSGDKIKALVAYQQVMNIYYTLGDTANATKIAERIKKIIGEMPNIREIADSLVQDAQNDLASGDLEGAETKLQYALGIYKALNDMSAVNKIEKLLLDVHTRIKIGENDEN